ncbi:hypothetical protein [Sulfurimonas sp.]
MKKALILSLLLAGISYADESFAQYEAQIQQMQEKTQQYNGDSSGEKKQNKYQYGQGSQNQESGSGSGNMYQGSHGKGGGRR